MCLFIKEVNVVLMFNQTVEESVIMLYKVIIILYKNLMSIYMNMFN